MKIVKEKGINEKDIIIFINNYNNKINGSKNGLYYKSKELFDYLNKLIKRENQIDGDYLNCPSNHSFLVIVESEGYGNELICVKINDFLIRETDIKINTIDELKDLLRNK